MGKIASLKARRHVLDSSLNEPNGRVAFDLDDFGGHRIAFGAGGGLCGWLWSAYLWSGLPVRLKPPLSKSH
jgi:hypothetical protein